MAELNRDHILPLYEQVKKHILSLIESGSLNPGDKLPSEKTLEDDLGVSRVTVRRALQELTHEERIVRVPGKGSFVLQAKIEPLTALTSFSENMRAQGYAPSYQQAQISTVEASPKVASMLKLPVASPVLQVSRLMLADGLPMAIQEAYLPYAIYQRKPSFFTPEVLTNISLYKVLELELGIKLYRADEWVDASKAFEDEAKKLKISPGDLLLIIERLTFSEENQPIEYVKLIFSANRYRYKVELFRPT
jgi:GntR family transcriptional regulator